MNAIGFRNIDSNQIQNYSFRILMVFQSWQFEQDENYYKHAKNYINVFQCPQDLDFNHNWHNMS